MKQKDICSYIVSSKCLAPTVDFQIKNIATSGQTFNNLFKVSYFEYNEQFMDTSTSKIENTFVSSEDSLVTEVDHTKLLGGTMFDVTYMKEVGVSYKVPGQFFSDWITPANFIVSLYIENTSSEAWKKQVDAWNYISANIKW
jgi:hypothetical protein